MTFTPYFDEEELKRLEEENASQEQILNQQAPTYDPKKNAAQTLYQEATPQENKAAGNVQPVKGATAQAQSQFKMPDLGQAVRGAAEGALAVPMGIMDFGMDAIGRIPGAEHIDDAWDEKTKFQNPLLQKLREAASIIVPSIGVGVLSGGTGAAVTAGGVARGLAVLGVNAVGDIGVNMISDQSTGDNLSTMAKEAMPWLPVPDALVVKDTDSPDVRRYKNMYESAGLSIVGDIIGYSLNAGKGIMSWFKPNDKAAEVYKAAEAMVNADSATAIRLSELAGQSDEAKAQAKMYADLLVQDPANALDHSVNLDVATKTANNLDKESVDLTKEYISTGQTKLTENPLESFVERQQVSRDLQIDDIGKERLMADPEGASGVDPTITPNLFPEGSTASFSITPGSTARNMADTTAIKFGGSTGTPAPMFSERAYYDMARGNSKSRDIIFNLAESTRQTGNFDAIVDGFRYTKDNMGEAAWQIYRDIITADSVDDVKKLFLEDRAVQPLLDGRKIKYINDQQALAVSYALKDLTDRYVGRVVTETSARAMDTVGREVSDIASGFKAIPETADYDRVTEMLADRIGFLMEEYSLNKYIAGWSLKNKDIWSKMVQKSQDPEATIKEFTKQFDLRSQQASTKGQSYRNMIVQVAKERPDAAQALIDAFALTKGDVDTIDKLMKWSAKQLSPIGLLRSDGDGLNAFAQGVWAIRYNNMLSGISALKAVTGNAVNLMLKPINSYLGTGIGMLMGKNTVDDLRKAHYVYGSFITTNKRALADSWETFKGLWNTGKWGDDFKMDPKLLAREDLVVEKGPSVWDTLAQMEPVWEKEGNWGRLTQYRFARFNYDLGNWRWFKYGTNALVSADSYVQSTIAQQLARARAWDEISSIGYKGSELAAQLKKVEKAAHAEMFDEFGNITDQALKYASGEIALNQDDAMAAWISSGINKLPILKPFFMFPKTGVNAAKLAMSYTPLATIPGTSRYAKVLWAGDNIDLIKEALTAHGLEFDALPDAMAVFKGLEAEYRGRLAFGSLLTFGLMGHAMAGNIRGNGPVDKGERRKLRDNFGWREKTINLGGKWVSYAGYEPLDTILTLVGDLSYYSRDIGSALTQDVVDKIAWTLSATFVNKTWTSGLEPLVSIVNGDETTISRMLANEVRSYIPLAGGLSVVNNAITSSQKDIYNDMIGYVKNRIPGLASTLPEQIDIYTGKPLNDIDNPILRALNAVNPVKVSEGTEPWRQWLIDSGWDGVQMIRKDSTGNHEYTPAEREQLYKYIGEMQLWKEFDKLSKNKKYNDQLDRVRAMRIQGRPSDEVDATQLETYSVMNDIMRKAQIAAEQRLQNENEPMWRSIQESIRNKDLMKQGRVDDAARAADRRKAEIERLTQMYR